MVFGLKIVNTLNHSSHSAGTESNPHTHTHTTALAINSLNACVVCTVALQCVCVCMRVCRCIRFISDRPFGRVCLVLNDPVQASERKTLGRLCTPNTFHNCGTLAHTLTSAAVDAITVGHNKDTSWSLSVRVCISICKCDTARLRSSECKRLGLRYVGDSVKSVPGLVGCRCMHAVCQRCDPVN